MSIFHLLLALRALIHECEEVEVCRVRLGLAGLDQPTNVTVDPGSGAALDHVSLVGVVVVPQLLWSCSHGPPLERGDIKIFIYNCTAALFTLWTASVLSY